jgi:hypothetical protein
MRIGHTFLGDRSALIMQLTITVLLRGEGIDVWNFTSTLQYVLIGLVLKHKLTLFIIFEEVTNIRIPYRAVVQCSK